MRYIKWGFYHTCCKLDKVMEDSLYLHQDTKTGRIRICIKQQQQ